MAQISGIEVQNIINMYGVEVTSIISIGGIDTANIPGWPGGASCTTFLYGYTDGKKYPPEDACTLEKSPYDWDDANQILYMGGGCGTNMARPGYYSDGDTIYSWDPRKGWSEYGTCGPAVGPTNISPPSIPSTINLPTSIMGTSGSWIGTGDLSYTYNWFSDDNLVHSSVSPEYNPKTGTYEDVQPFYNPSYNELFTTMQLQVTASDDTGSTVALSNAVRTSDYELTLFLSSSGITDNTTISALEYLQKAIKSDFYLRDYLLDYYPFAGTTVDTQKWSLKNPYRCLDFSSGWTFGSNGAQADSNANGGQGTYATSSIPFDNLNGYLTDIGIYNGADVAENSIDIAVYYIYNYGYSLYSTVQLSLQTTSNILQINSNQGNLYTASISSPLGLVGIASNGPYGNMAYTAFRSYSGDPSGSVLGTWSPIYPNASSYQNYKIRIGAGASSPSTSFLPGNKLYKFAYAGSNLGYNDGTANLYNKLSLIIQTYQSMLGRAN
jgi:hypothetical protein